MKFFFLPAIFLLTSSPVFTQEIVETAVVAKSIDDIIWVLVSAMLVFLMQAGFMALETGRITSYNVCYTKLLRPERTSVHKKPLPFLPLRRCNRLFQF